MKKYLNTTIDSECPICESNNANLLWEASVEEASSHFINRLESFKLYNDLSDHLKNLFSNKSIQIHHCLSCDFCFSFPYKAGDKYFYDMAFAFSNAYPKWRWEYDQAITWITKFKKSPKILEIGAGEGVFLKKLISKAYTKSQLIVATEFSSFGKKQIENLDIQCFSKDIRDPSLGMPIEKFDVICMFAVLEHMDGLNELMNKLCSMLDDDGVMLVSVPNNKRIEFNELNGALKDMPPNHVGRWSIKAFQALAKKNQMILLDFNVEDTSFFHSFIQFFSYRFLRKSQNHKTIHAFAKFKLNGIFKKIGISLCMLLDIFLNLPKLIILFFYTRKNGGNSQFVVFGKLD